MRVIPRTVIVASSESGAFCSTLVIRLLLPLLLNPRRAKPGEGGKGTVLPFPDFCIFVFYTRGEYSLDALEKKQSRKWMVTINNPLDHGFTHDAIIALMSGVRGQSLYWCMCDEEGDECETLHTHIFIYRSSPFTARQIDNLFPKMHRDNCYGTALESRAYVLKDGEKFNKAPDGSYDYTDSKGKRHQGINYSDSFFEFGTCPDEHQGKSAAAVLIVDMVRDGASNREIVETVASAYKDIDKIERTRSMFRDAQYANCWRDLAVTYIFGSTGSGKTRSVMDRYGYSNCYRVTDYKHPFDTYDGQDVIIFEEFRSSLKHGDMLNYLDGYPLLLPCRYFNRQACFTKVFIITNVPPEDQYPNIDKESRLAFWRRIHTITEYMGNGFNVEYKGLNDWMHRHDFERISGSGGGSAHA